MIVLEVLCREFVMHKKAGFVTGTSLSEQKPEDAKYIPYSPLINKTFLMSPWIDEGWVTFVFKG